MIDYKAAIEDKDTDIYCLEHPESSFRWDGEEVEMILFVIKGEEVQLELYNFNSDGAGEIGAKLQDGRLMDLSLGREYWNDSIAAGFKKANPMPYLKSFL
jgi:hypothetical protein